jgi:hypothetical protein
MRALSEHANASHRRSVPEFPAGLKTLILLFVFRDFFVVHIRHSLFSVGSIFAFERDWNNIFIRFKPFRVSFHCL